MNSRRYQKPMHAFLLLCALRLSVPAGVHDDWQVFDTTNSNLPGNAVSCLARDSAGHIWAGTSGYGLLKFDSAWRLFTQQTMRLPDNFIQTIHVDAVNSVWVGTQSGGIARYRTSWKVFTTSNCGLPSNNITALRHDKNGTLVAGTGGGGLALYNGYRWTVFDTANSPLSSNYISAVNVAHDNTYWIGQWLPRSPLNGELSLVRGAQWGVASSRYANLPDAHAQVICELAAGATYIGWFQNGFSIATETFDTTIVSGNNLLHSNDVTCLLSRANGEIWIGTAEKGIAVVAGSTWSYLHAGNTRLPAISGSRTIVTGMVEDAHGAVWVGTAHGGIAVYDTAHRYASMNAAPRKQKAISSIAIVVENEVMKIKSPARRSGTAEISLVSGSGRILYRGRGEFDRTSQWRIPLNSFRSHKILFAVVKETPSARSAQRIVALPSR
ncbi:MAG: hypothetical protein GF398_13715 [Chitinivibrionales bacterium]|nr:hypothetical protein [Chitinivibrionales bacterium]